MAGRHQTKIKGVTVRQIAQARNRKLKEGRTRAIRHSLAAKKGKH